MTTQPTDTHLSHLLARVVYPYPFRVEVDLHTRRIFRCVQDLTPPIRALALAGETDLSPFEERLALDIADRSEVWHPRRPSFFVAPTKSPVENVPTLSTASESQSLSPVPYSRRANVLRTVVIEVAVDLLAGRVREVLIDATDPIRAVAPTGDKPLTSQEEEDALQLVAKEHEEDFLWPDWIDAGCLTPIFEPLDPSYLPPD